MKRQVEYKWRLSELMAARGLHNTTDLIPLLAERGIALSRPQVYRLVNQKPERVALQVIAAICDIFSCGPEDLITVTAADVRARKTAPAPPMSWTSTAPSAHAEPASSTMTTESPAGLTPRNTSRGRPRTSGTATCARCGRAAGKTRATWPEGKICGPCFTTATRTHGTCPDCGQHRLLPGPSEHDGPRCGPCAGILHNFHCARCGHEGEFYRRGICARCALGDDLTELLLTSTADPATAQRLVDVLFAADRPESIITWKRSPKVQDLLTSLSSGQTPLTHEGLDEHRETAGRAADHLRALLVHHGLLPYQDPYLARFESWIKDKLKPLPAEVAKPVEYFATWHHLRRIRSMATPDTNAQAPVHSAKQEITETIKFLDWLWQTHHRTAATCTQQDIETWIATGPTTRKSIRTFIVFAKKTGTNHRVDMGHYTAKTRPDNHPGPTPGLVAGTAHGHQRIPALQGRRNPAPPLCPASGPGSQTPRRCRGDRRNQWHYEDHLWHASSSCPSAFCRPAEGASSKPAEPQNRIERREPLAIPGNARRPTSPPQRHHGQAPKPRHRPKGRTKHRTRRTPHPFPATAGRRRPRLQPPNRVPPCRQRRRRLVPLRRPPDQALTSEIRFAAGVPDTAGPAYGHA